MGKYQRFANNFLDALYPTKGKKWFGHYWSIYTRNFPQHKMDCKGLRGRYALETSGSIPYSKTTVGKSWNVISCQDELLLAPYFKTHGSAPFNSIWRAWQITSKKLCWYDHTLSHGLNFASSSIWWKWLVQENNSPLAILKYLKGRQLFRKGICVFHDLWDSLRFDWKSWERIKSQFNLSSIYKRPILQVL